MKRFTVFTFMYLAVGICLTAIAFGQPDLAPSLKKLMLFNAGMLYLAAVLSTFRFWQQSIFKSRLRKQRPIGPWLVIVGILGLLIFTVLTNHRTTDVIAQGLSGLTPVLLSVESLFAKHRTQS